MNATGDSERTRLAVRRHLDPLMVLGVLFRLHCPVSAILLLSPGRAFPQR